METLASVKTKCDGCGATISANSSYADKRGAMSLYLKDGEDAQGYDKNSRYDYCGEACMLAHLTARAKANKIAKAGFGGFMQSQASVLELDIPATLPKKAAEAAK